MGEPLADPIREIVRQIGHVEEVVLVAESLNVEQEQVVAEYLLQPHLNQRPFRSALPVVPLDELAIPEVLDIEEAAAPLNKLVGCGEAQRRDFYPGLVHPVDDRADGLGHDEVRLV